jgi:hypothetical protein
VKLKDIGGNSCDVFHGKTTSECRNVEFSVEPETADGKRHLINKNCNLDHPS